MPSNKKDNKGQAKKYEHVNSRDIRSFIMIMEREIRLLAKKTKELPTIDENGNSECSFAEDLYAEKEEITEEVVKGLKKLRLYKRYMNDSVATNQKNLKTIKSKRTSLHLDRAKEQFTFAQFLQEYSLKNTIQLRNVLEALITWAEKVFSLTRARKFPGGKPKKRIRSPLMIGGGIRELGEGAPAAPALGRPFEIQINSLMSLGPLRESE